MSLNKQLSETQMETFQKLMSPESNWPNELRDRFDERCSSVNTYRRDLDREVVSDYIRDTLN